MALQLKKLLDITIYAGLWIVTLKCSDCSMYAFF